MCVVGLHTLILSKTGGDTSQNTMRTCQGEYELFVCFALSCFHTLVKTLLSPDTSRFQLLTQNTARSCGLGLKFMLFLHLCVLCREDFPLRHMFSLCCCKYMHGLSRVVVNCICLTVTCAKSVLNQHQPLNTRLSMRLSTECHYMLHC